MEHIFIPIYDPYNLARYILYYLRFIVFQIHRNEAHQDNNVMHHRNIYLLTHTIYSLFKR